MHGRGKHWQQSRKETDEIVILIFFMISGREVENLSTEPKMFFKVMEHTAKIFNSLP